MVLSNRSGGGVIVESIRVYISSTISVYYWYNLNRNMYQYTRSDTPLCIETDAICSLKMSYEEFIQYIQSKHV